MLDPKEKWIGPFQIRDLLEASPTFTSVPSPPDFGSAYLVTRSFWQLRPALECVPLYVGGNTGNSARFKTRIGDLLADAFGFYTDTTGHSSGGQHIHKWCKENRVSPLDLHIAWVDKTKCHRCLENRLFAALRPSLLNRVTPSRCPMHT